MSRIKHPGQKKRLSLSRDHRVHARHDKNFRSEWPLKKARTNRKFRHAGKAALAAVVADEASDVPLDNAHVSLKRQRSLRKEDVQSLADWIADRRKYREWSNPKDPNDERRARFVPDGRTAIALVRIMWQAMHPESDYGEA
jgi:hypothetical protein